MPYYGRHGYYGGRRYHDYHVATMKEEDIMIVTSIDTQDMEDTTTTSILSILKLVK